MAKHFLLMLHSSYNQNHQSQWSRVQTRHYRDEKYHRVNSGENNIFVFCSHMEFHKNMSNSNVCWRKTNALRTNKQLVYKRHFKKGMAVQKLHNIHNRTSQLYITLVTWISNREQYLEVQTYNRAFLGKRVKPNLDVIQQWLTRDGISRASTFYVTFT